MRGATLLMVWLLASVAWAEAPVTVEACQKDRRCRLQLFEQALASQRAETARQEQALRELAQRRQEQARRYLGPVRQWRRLGVDFTGSSSVLVGREGVLVGWALTPAWRVELLGALSNTPSNAQMSASGLAATARVRLTLFDTPFSPYVAGGLGFYSFSRIGQSGLDTTAPQSQEGSAEALALVFGLDWQTRLGLHFGVEMQYLSPLYTVVRDSSSHLQSDLLGGQLASAMRLGRFGVSALAGWTWDI
jgi:hypothetical protein